MDIMKFIPLLISCLIFVLLTTATCWSHGVDGHIEQTVGYCVTARYDDGEPMSYAAVEISAPDAEIGFQTGRTDRNGCFMFRPEVQGKWNVVVNDGMGHRLALPLELGAGSNATGTNDAVVSAPVQSVSRPVKIITGLCIIFGLYGILYGWKARRVSR
jgi:nickel transport protein